MDRIEPPGLIHSNCPVTFVPLKRDTAAFLYVVITCLADNMSINVRGNPELAWRHTDWLLLEHQ